MITTMLAATAVAAAAASAKPALLDSLQAVPRVESLAKSHAWLAAEPHPAGSPGDARMIQRLAAEMKEMGLEVEIEPFFALLPRHRSSSVTVLAGGRTIALPLREKPVPGDSGPAHPDAADAWNAYSGAGDVTGQVVYVNYGSRADFDELRRQGVSLLGKIAIARYGKVYRGDKARLAEEAGAAALLLYTDPDDSGYRRGIPYPEGGWANEHSIERGSVKTLTYPGDPLTPFEPATKDARRLDPKSVAMLRIPVQAMGWGAASEILGRMRGPAVPAGWQGGLPFAYRVTGGDELRVRVTIDQDRAILETANVIGRVRGAVMPEQMVVVGCHFDAWTFGAGDPHAGTIVVLEMARSFAEAAKRGVRPDRTVVFAHWGAEEFGIIGSTEWVEAHREDLAKNAVAYINLDMAAMGPEFGASASPLLEAAIVAATAHVPQAGATGSTVQELWLARHGGNSRVGDLGGGSDHLGFYSHLGIPSTGFGAWGSPGVSYHTNYETLAWYHHVVGDDYQPALMLTRIGNALVSDLTSSTFVPLDPRGYAPRLRRHLDAAASAAEGTPAEVRFPTLVARVNALEASAQRAGAALEKTAATNGVSVETRRAVDALLIGLERAWIAPEGLPGRPWYRNLYAATDPDSGYGSWTLPLLREAIGRQDAAAEAAAVKAYERVLDRLLARLEAIEAIVVNKPAP